MPPSNTSWTTRAKNLIVAVRDVAATDHPSPLLMSAAGPRHRHVFSTYVRKLRAAKKVADEWWESLVENNRGSRRRNGREEAVRRAKELRPLGPRSDPNFIGLLRQYWFECWALNATVNPEQRVPPEDFLLAWLIEAGEDELAEFVSGLTYWPVGQDKKGRWV